MTAFSTTAFAAQSTDADVSKPPISLSKEYNGQTLDKINIENSIESRAWPGSGPAAQVTSVKIVDYGYLGPDFPGHEGNVGIVVQVMGHGRDYTTYDGVDIDYFRYDPIILTGTLVDGWYYYFDCGPATVGTHQFKIRMVSHNSPYTERTANFTLNITE